jgi:hypothetical protein
MPFKSVEEAKKKHPSLGKYSEKAQSGWLKSINNCFSQGGNDSKCFPIAWSVANKVDGKKAKNMEIAKQLLKMAKEIVQGMVVGENRL